MVVTYSLDFLKGWLMLVSGNLNKQILFRPSWGELAFMNRLFPNMLVRHDEGYTMAVYDIVDEVLIKGQNHFGAIAEKTSSFGDKQEALTSIKRGVLLSTGQVVDVSDGIAKSPKSVITSDELGYVFNHIPQMFTSVSGDSTQKTVITAFDGYYDFRAQVFKGLINTSTVAKLWP